MDSEAPIRNKVPTVTSIATFRVPSMVFANSYLTSNILICISRALVGILPMTKSAREYDCIVIPIGYQL